MSQRKQSMAGTASADSAGAALSENERDLADVLRWLLADVKAGAIPMRRECRWSIPALFAVALLWVWLDEPTLTRRFAKSLKIGRRLFQSVPKVSYQAFIKLLGRHTASALGLLKPLLRGADDDGPEVSVRGGGIPDIRSGRVAYRAGSHGVQRSAVFARLREEAETQEGEEGPQVTP